MHPKDMTPLSVTICAAVALAMLIAVFSTPAQAAEVALTVGDVRQRAASFNRQYLSAQEDLAQARSRVGEARAGIFPDIELNGSYGRNFIIPSFFAKFDDTPTKIETGFKNNFATTLTVRQPVWEGGKVINAWAIARLYRHYSEHILESVGDNVEYNSDLLFYTAILQRSLLETLEKAHEATLYNLQVVEKQHGQGVVSQFELLRARVENANLEPAILQAESDLRLAERRLKSFIGVNLRDTVQLVEDADDTSLASLPGLDELTRLALEKRPEMQSATILTEITRKAIAIAKADYQPNLDATYTWDRRTAADDFTLGANESKTSTFGLQLTVPIFKGGRIGARVNYYRADYNKTRIAEQQLADDIALEVEQAYDQLIQAKKSLDVQKETIAQAEEGLKIADLRYQQGVGTQLEVLSAQSALTSARSSLAQALFFFRTSKSGLKKATTIEI